MFLTLLLTISRILRAAWQSVSSRFPLLRAGIAVEVTKRLRVDCRLNGIVDEISKRKEGTIDISRVGPRRDSPSGHGLSGREIATVEKGSAVALPELLDLIEHGREAPRLAL